jgi:transcriptional regulator GlxA family with amidase domain
MPQTTVGILIFDQVEVLDFCGPLEVFSVARLDENRRRQDASPFNVLLVADRPGPVFTASGMRVLPDCTLDDCPRLDILLVPGGWGTRRELSNQRIINWIRNRAAQAEVTASVCTGALLLASAGLLQGRRATTHWAALELLREQFIGISVQEQLHVVDEGSIMTSAGIDLALLLVARYCGEAVARATARYMEYPYPNTVARRVDVREVGLNR